MISHETRATNYSVMNTATGLFFSITLTTALALTQNLWAGGGWGGGPRLLEEKPWLARQGALRSPSVPLGERVAAAIGHNRALASSPRMREQFPVLALGYALVTEKESFEAAPVK